MTQGRSLQRRRAPGRQSGFALPAMVFMVVIVGLLLGAGLLMLGQAQHTQSLQLQAARALAAAKSAGEWGLWQVSDPDGSQGLAASVLPPCFATQAISLPTPLSDLSVQVSCTRDPVSGSVDEGGLKLASYRVLAVVSAGGSGSIDFVQRQFEARYTACKNPGGTAPTYAC